MTLVTFIIPTIGRDTLQRSLQSLYAQTNRDWKAIVIFDGIDPNIVASDERVTITSCEKAGTCEVVNGVEKPNGAGHVRNFGIKMCATEWIAFLDDDDTLAHTYVDTLLNEIHLCYRVDMVIFRMLHPEYGVLPKISSTQFQKYEVGISFAIKRHIFEDGLQFTSSHDEDYSLLCDIREKGYKIVMSPYVKYFVHDVNHTEQYHEQGRRMIINR